MLKGKKNEEKDNIEENTSEVASISEPEIQETAPEVATDQEPSNEPEVVVQPEVTVQPQDASQSDTSKGPTVDVKPETAAPQPEKATYKQESKEKFEYDEAELLRRRFLGPRKEDMNFLRDKWILSKINDDELLEYLKLEERRNELVQQAKDVRQKRMITAFELTISLLAGVAAIYFLKDNPTILINVIYMCGLLIAFWLWKKPHDK